MRRLGKPVKRVLASLLAAGMLASMMPAGALADESAASVPPETKTSEESNVVTEEPVVTSEEGPAETETTEEPTEPQTPAGEPAEPSKEETSVVQPDSLQKAPEVTFSAEPANNGGEPYAADGTHIATYAAGQALPLEETGGLTVNPASTLVYTSNMGKVFTHATHWNDQGQYGAAFNDVDVFKSTEFTVLFDVLPTSPSGDTNILTKRAALTIGTDANKIRVPTWDGKIGYGAETRDGGMSVGYTSIEGYKQDDWNCIAVIYREADGGNGSLEVYIDGELAGSVPNLGFKFSTMDGITAMLSRSVNTDYLQEGTYDNIVVGNYAMSAEDAMAETAKRAEAKDNLPADTAALQAAIAEAKALEGSVTFTDRLMNALMAAEMLLANNPTGQQQAEVDAAARELTAALDEIATDAAKAGLAALVKQIQANVAADQAAGVVYADEPLEAW